ncbi:MAG: hypothetical protein IOD00_05705, partial [Rhodobacter sp.]|nr:hypothetical protein [Rhodobacter sp.]
MLNISHSPQTLNTAPAKIAGTCSPGRQWQDCGYWPVADAAVVAPTPASYRAALTDWLHNSRLEFFAALHPDHANQPDTVILVARRVADNAACVQAWRAEEPRPDLAPVDIAQLLLGGQLVAGMAAGLPYTMLPWGYRSEQVQTIARLIFETPETARKALGWVR